MGRLRFGRKEVQKARAFYPATAALGTRILVTQDADMLRLHAAGAAHAGIASCHPQSRSIGEIIRGLALIWDLLEAEDMQGKVEFL